MKVYHNPNITEVIGIGDTHGTNDWIPSNGKRIGLENAVIFHVGDFGVGFGSEGADRHWLNKLNDGLSKIKTTMYVIRGNHDNPKRFNGKWNFSNLILLEDYDVVTINGKYAFLCVGGAKSIDRKVLSEGYTWWPEEEFKYDPSVMQKLIETGVNITHVIAHTCPSFAPPTTFAPVVYHYTQNDPGLLEELIAERKVVTEFYTDLSKHYHIKEWVYGHFHSSNVEYIEGTKFTCLNIKEVKGILSFESDEDFVNRNLNQVK